MATVLRAFPYRVPTGFPGDGCDDARPVILRRAIAHIEEHAHTDLSVADIAESAHVSVRTVQCAFRRHLDTTPMGYVRRVRLAHAHAELVAAGAGSETTVTAVAARWGFFQPGRFASVYRGVYGCLPHETLHRNGP
ncbi:helix-turn-helix transcriptional regulator [Streptomyces sp. NPDC004111]|uniref:helix-turn-helix transcriptional regulator n=1 Tax=Streptomyces sp. NPDC004111 TaxID=3364690 RepID=UPI003692A748